jgi:hypothetical protein
MNAIPPYRPVLLPAAIERPSRAAAARRTENASSPPAIATPSPALPPDAAAEVAAAESTPSILTAEERDFFAARAILGSLSYRPRQGAAETLAPPTGQRIDVRG